MIFNTKRLTQKYSTYYQELEAQKKENQKIFAFVEQCVKEVKELQQKQREQERKNKIVKGLYIEIYNFVENEKKVYRGRNGNQTLCYGTDLGKIYHQMIQEKKELSKNIPILRINGVKPEIPEINIIEIDC